MWIELLKKSNGVQNSRILVGIRFIKYEAIRTASTQKCFETLVVNIIVHATSNKCLFFLLVIPFCYGVSKHVDR